MVWFRLDRSCFFRCVFWIIKKRRGKKKKRDESHSRVRDAHACDLCHSLACRSYHIPAVPFAQSVRCKLIIAASYDRSFTHSRLRDSHQLSDTSAVGRCVWAANRQIARYKFKEKISVGVFKGVFYFVGMEKINLFSDISKVWSLENALMKC